MPVDSMVKWKEELDWLKKYPAFEQRPATIYEFLGPEYLNIEGKVRVRIKDSLTEIMGEEVSGDRIAKYPLAIISGAVGIGKTTIASIVLPWLCHWVLCLKDPQDYFDLLPGSRIAFMQMSTSGPQALEVIFGDIKARIQHSKWFAENFPFDPNFKNQIRFPKDIWIIPGDSAETTFEGYNILGGILDEADSHKVTKNKDYADVGYTSIYSRVTSRFQDRGFIMVIGQMKKANGFAARKFREFTADPNAYAERMTIWESLGPDKYAKDEDGNVIEFGYDIKRKLIVPAQVARIGASKNLILIPEVYKKDFLNNPEKALRDLAGIPPKTGDPFITLDYKIEEAQDRWMRRNDGLESPVTPDGKIERWFRCSDSIKRAAHIDLAYSANGDALGLAMGHVREVIEIDGEKKPYIIIDFAMRIHAAAGTQIMFSDVRHVIYDLKDKLGFKINKITMDGFQSTDSMQQFRRKRITTEGVSADKDVLVYEDLREALYEDRIEIPKYLVDMQIEGRDERVNIIYRELSELEQTDKGIPDHPMTGSKDVADAVAGVTFTLMGDRAYRRNVVSMESYRHETRSPAEGRLSHPAFSGGGMSAPLPPQATRSTWG